MSSVIMYVTHAGIRPQRTLRLTQHCAFESRPVHVCLYSLSSLSPLPFWDIYPQADTNSWGIVGSRFQDYGETRNLKAIGAAAIKSATAGTTVKGICTSEGELVRNLMAHAQKPHFVFRLNGRVHLNRRGSQFSRLLAAEVCASPLEMLDIPRSKVVWEFWLPTPFASFPFTSPPVRHRVPPHSERSIT